MKKEVFANRLANLRKKKGYTQAELAEKLNVSNKTVSRWETAEGYPDISLIKPLSELLGVTCDELLSDEMNYSNVTKYDIQKFLPFVISLIGVLLFYIFQKLSVPILLSFGIFIGVLILSFYFVIKHTNKKHLTKVIYWNMLMLYFPLTNFIFNIMLGFYFINVTSSVYGAYGMLSDFSSMMEEIITTLSANNLIVIIILPYLFAFIIVLAMIFYLLRYFNKFYKVKWNLYTEKKEQKLPMKIMLLTIGTIAILLGFWYWKYISLMNTANTYFENTANFDSLIDIANAELTVAKFEINIIISILCIVQFIMVLKSKYKKFYLPSVLFLFIYCILVTVFTTIENIIYIQSPMLLIMIGAGIIGIVYLLMFRRIKKITDKKDVQ